MANNILKDRRLWLITIVVFILLLTFFDRNNFLERGKLKARINELETQKAYYLEKIEQDSTVIQRLKDNDYLEQYAREHYLMRREGDEVFIIE